MLLLFLGMLFACTANAQELMLGNPVQSEVSMTTFKLNGALITPRYSYDITARVLGKERYWFDEKASVIPYDLALGWGPMSLRDNIDKIDISQSNRWYYWWVDTFFISRRTIEVNSANVHIVPANSSIKEVLSSLDTHDVVRLKGYLVDVSTPEWLIQSSNVRTDVGAGACEVMYVQEIDVFN
ncbi:hypothetical protein [Vibrio owensii]|uniref:hypothetical protein n=1 Tax=Vibrio owensii TaxID=696485 RepID=UPI003CC619EE